MNLVVPASPFLSLSAVIRALRGSLGGWGVRGLLGAALVLLVYRRLGEIISRIEGLAARFQAGRVLRWGPRVETTATVPAVPRERGTAERIWPRGFGWLVKAAGWQAAGFGSQLRAVLETPEMVALLTAAPEAARVLRPLCRMLAIETAVLRPGVAAEVVARVAVEKPKRVRAPRAKPDLGRVPIPRGVMSAVRRGRFLLG